MKHTLYPTLVGALIATMPIVNAATVLAPSEDVMTSQFFSGTDLVRGYDGDGRTVHRVSSKDPFAVAGYETMHLTFGFTPGDYTGPVASAILTLTSASGGFGGDASAVAPFLVSAHGVDLNPLTGIIDDTNPGGSVTWSDFTANNILAASPEAHTSVNAVSGTFDFDVTALVNSWIDGSNTVYAIAMTGKNDVSGNDFLHGFVNNSETAGSTFLTINQVPEPSSALLLMGASAAGIFLRRRR